ncbi:hypothetical protein BC829DRAFT_85412 [Chytridium lagenaria]|nr:hypothetical protein BC829DRAFT_85412 [Chytridium lagenaria]
MPSTNHSWDPPPTSSAELCAYLPRDKFRNFLYKAKILVRDGDCANCQISGEMCLPCKIQGRAFSIESLPVDHMERAIKEFVRRESFGTILQKGGVVDVKFWRPFGFTGTPLAAELQVEEAYVDAMENFWWLLPYRERMEFLKKVKVFQPLDDCDNCLRDGAKCEDCIEDGGFTSVTGLSFEVLDCAVKSGVCAWRRMFSTRELPTSTKDENDYKAYAPATNGTYERVRGNSIKFVHPLRYHETSTFAPAFEPTSATSWGSSHATNENCFFNDSRIDLLAAEGSDNESQSYAREPAVNNDQFVHPAEDIEVAVDGLTLAHPLGCPEWAKTLFDFAPTGVASFGGLSHPTNEDISLEDSRIDLSAAKGSYNESQSYTREPAVNDDQSGATFRQPLPAMMMQSPASYQHAAYSLRDFKHGIPFFPSYCTKQTMQPPLMTAKLTPLEERVQSSRNFSRALYTLLHPNDDEVSKIFGGPSPWTEGESARADYRSNAPSASLKSREPLTAMVGALTSAKSDKGQLQMKLEVREPASQDARKTFKVNNFISRRQSRRKVLYSRSAIKKKAVALPPNSPALSLNQGQNSVDTVTPEPSIDGDQSSGVVTLPVSTGQDPILAAVALRGSNVNEDFNSAVVTPPESSLDEGSSSAVSPPECSLDEGLNVDTTASLRINVIEGSSCFDCSLSEASSVEAMSPYSTPIMINKPTQRSVFNRYQDKKAAAKKSREEGEWLGSQSSTSRSSRRPKGTKNAKRCSLVVLRDVGSESYGVSTTFEKLGIKKGVEDDEGWMDVSD